MNEIKKAIDILKTLYVKSCKMVDGRKKGGFIDDAKTENIAINAAISALEKQLNGGWIPVSERLPECEREVLIFTKGNKITTAMYEDGKMPEDESMWNWYDVDFDYDEENDINYVGQGIGYTQSDSIQATY